MTKLSILIPQYKETNEIVKPLLDSIAIQQNIDFEDIEVIIVNDGTDIHLTNDFLDIYKFKITYYQNEHKGVSATRNKALDLAKGEYVMFCDADDMFFRVDALWIILSEIERTHFDTLVSCFMEESKLPNTNQHFYIERGRFDPQTNQGEIDSVFVHGKVHKRKYLKDNNIRWDENLTIHEDSYFNTLCQKLTQNAIYCPIPFYLWKWRDDSVCRHDDKYILKTYNNMLESSTALTNELLARGKKDETKIYVTSMIYDAYLILNKKEWLNQENQVYRKNTELRFKKYYSDFKYLYDELDENIKNQIYIGIKNRMFMEGLTFESITFSDWIKHIEELDDDSKTN